MTDSERKLLLALAALALIDNRRPHESEIGKLASEIYASKQAAETPRTCETCAHEVEEQDFPECNECLRATYVRKPLPNWTPKTTASEETSL